MSGEDPAATGDVILVGASLDSAERFDFADGRAALLTRPCPGSDHTNEDACAAIPYDRTSGVIVVADGVGGLPSGADAARLTIESLRSSVSTARRVGTPLREAVLSGIEMANRHIRSEGKGSATTIAVAQIRGRRVRPYHVGDSGVLVTGQRGRVKLLTSFHSPVGYAMEAGLMDAEEAVHHEERHIVSNVVGTADMRIEMGSPIELALRDTLLVASDGLFDNLLPAEIIELVRKGPLESVAAALAKKITARMTTQRNGPPSKPDDLTFALFRPI